MHILPAKECHIPGMLNLLLQVGEVHHQIRPDLFRPGTLKYGETALKELLQDPQRPIFVAVEGDFVQGYCFCVHKDYRDSGMFTPRRELYIDDLCVEETCRGQGVASALYAHVQGYAKGCGCSHITLNVWCGNEGAMKFYEHAGLTPRSITMETAL